MNTEKNAGHEAYVPATEEGAMTIPKWFLWVASGVGGIFVAAFIPWAAWVSMTLATLSVKLEATHELRARLNKAETTINEHLADPHVHQPLKNRVDRLEDRIKQLENGK